MLRHLVLCTWKPGTPPEKVREIEEAFRALPARIPQIAAFEWGTDVSRQGLARGFTHCFAVSFASEADRDAYAVHPDHQAYMALSRPHAEQLMTFDYFAAT